MGLILRRGGFAGGAASEDDAAAMDTFLEVADGRLASLGDEIGGLEPSASLGETLVEGAGEGLVLGALS